MSCNFTANFELARNIYYSVFDTISDVCSRTYIRPDPGGSMMPWLGSLLLLFLHLPACIIRAVKWESAQYLALGLAVLGIALTVQAYVSTALNAAEVLVWMPLTLILDIGAMLQMVVLIIEKHDDRWQKWKKIREGEEPPRGWRVLRDAIKKLLQDIKKFVKRKLLRRRRRRDAEAQNGVQLDPLVNHIRDPAGRAAEPEPEPDNPYPDALHYAIVALISFVFLIMLLILQSYGLYAAFMGRRVQDIRVNWCSPAFRDFVVAITTGNCEKLEVIDSSSNGIGCISLPGDQQRDWLLGTIIALIAALVCQILDAAFMIVSDAGWRPRHMRVRRPWLTMIGGCATLGVLIIYGVINANNLPQGVTETVWIYRKEPSREKGRVCKGKLDPPGLRGVIIGYMDGLFESWGVSYHGH